MKANENKKIKKKKLFIGKAAHLSEVNMNKKCQLWKLHEIILIEMMDFQGKSYSQ